MPADIQMASKIASKTKVATLRLTPDQYRSIESRAKKCGVRVSEWIRAIVMQAATRKSDEGYLRIREPDGVIS